MTATRVRVDRAALRAELERRRVARSEHADPVAWGQRRGLESWSKQGEWLTATTTERQVAVPSGHGTGKSYGAAWRIAHQVMTAPDPYVLLTAPTGGQLSNVLRPLRDIHDQLKLPGYIRGGGVPAWIMNGREVMTARSTSDVGQSTLAGPHAADLLVVADEADGLAAAVWEQIEGMLTGARNRLLALGNPRNPGSRWRELVEAGGWAVHRLSVLDTPAFTGEKVSTKLRSVLPSLEWLDARRQAWGEGTALWMARVLGLWPDAADNAILALALVEESRRHPDDRAEDRHQPGDDRPLYACDVAGDGEDRTVIGRIVNREYRTLEVRQDWDTEDAATALIKLLKAHPGARAIVDADGLGAGVRDKLRARGFAGRTLEFKAARSATRPKDHKIVKDEAWWQLRETLGTSFRLDPDDPHGQDLDGELTAVQYYEDAVGRIRVEDKPSFKKRLSKSPDLGDTLMMAGYGLRLVQRGGSTRPAGNRRPARAARARQRVY